MSFKIFHRKRKPAELKRLGVHDGYHLTWEKKELPGSGAQQYAWETYGLPPYPRFGNGNIHVTNPLRETSPASYTFQAVGIVGSPPQGQLQGQFVTQPLMDPTVAEYAGIVLPGVIPNNISPNQVVTGAKATLNP
jgi:hypothetical protein